MEIPTKFLYLEEKEPLLQLIGNIKLYVDIIKKLFIGSTPQISKPADCNKKSISLQLTLLFLFLSLLFSFTAITFFAIYATDTENSYSFVKEWGTLVTESDGNHFNRPTDLAIDPYTNHIYVADSGNNRIQVFDTEGK